jgi:hypothetical protein
VLSGETAVPFADHSLRTRSTADCQRAYRDCIDTGGCFDYVDCVGLCPDAVAPADCARRCFDEHDKGKRAAADYLQCVCDSRCGAACTECDVLRRALAPTK